jgi:F420H(2)-dependent quinone reductase
MTAMNETTGNQPESSGSTRQPGTPGAFSRWMQHRMNARMNRKVRRGKGSFMGMDVLILHTVGCRSGEARETPVAWFADGEDAWQRIATAQPRIAKYQSKSDRQYPVVRLTLR